MGFQFQIIDYWLLFFLMSTSLNIAVHILVDKYYQAEQKSKALSSAVTVLVFKAYFYIFTQIYSCLDDLFADLDQQNYN